ncbi:hypothetical protein Adu01nite_17810 [Paractinoplanes durhamensis]|uniref:Uncharacterized protein n=1 Tax=Paractinoplanes durhamensis TaxID=113563 RepID=A0ABQ3YS62_9ACTN|nr:hypothetical protein Adu01nite_17810 [Actinoplanes durhamensis]
MCGDTRRQGHAGTEDGGAGDGESSAQAPQTSLSWEHGSSFRGGWGAAQLVAEQVIGEGTGLVVPTELARKPNVVVPFAAIVPL